MEVEGLIPPTETKAQHLDPSLTETAKETEKIKKRDEMMQFFWKKFDEKWPDSIPPGIIFLPGDRVQIEGFGWAPRTWLSAHEVDFPDPLSFFDLPTELDSQNKPPRGLKVRYPGFRLYVEDQGILFSVTGKDRPGRVAPVKFPVGQGLQEWYRVESVDEASETWPGQNPSDEDKELAIILSRSRPQEFPPEIGLLVQIYDHSDEVIETRYQGNKDGQKPDVAQRPIERREKRVLHCQILRRVKVSRIMTPSAESPQRKQEGSKDERSYVVPEILVPGAGDNKICVGEVLESDQEWLVDGYFQGRTRSRSTQKGKDKVSRPDPSDQNDRARKEPRQRFLSLNRLRSSQLDEAVQGVAAVGDLTPGGTASTRSGKSRLSGWLKKGRKT